MYVYSHNHHHTCIEPSWASCPIESTWCAFAWINGLDKKLCQAISDEDFPRVLSLLSQFAPLGSLCSETRMTPLHLAVSKGNGDIVRLLLTNGADVNARDSGNGTPLHYAATYGFEDISSDLINAGALVNAETYSPTLNQTPLNHVAWTGNVRLAQLLLNSGANVNHRDSLDRTPLNVATQMSYLELVNLLISHGGTI